jgi:hypothetical protein
MFMQQRLVGLVLALVGLVSLAPPPVSGQPSITSARDLFGFDIGDDYQLATYVQLTDWWQRLDEESDRLRLVEIGRTEEDRPQWMAIITSPENHRKLDRLREISRRLALAEDVSTEDDARALAAEGRVVVWVDGGLHANEVLGAHQLMELVHQMVSRTDPETLRILDDVVLLAVHANPDGHDLVSGWYMRDADPARRSTAGLPVLYQKYAGHDNNRDGYMAALRETANMNRVLYREWFPQIMYNHHQTGPAGTVMFAPPFRDPFNYVYDPLIPTSLDLVGAAMHTRFAAEGKPGVTMRRGANYSTWWNGGLRTTVYFHNMIGLLTETIGHPTPMEIPFRPDRTLPSGDLPFPIEPQTWHFRQSVEYSMTANRAVLDVASRYREQFLFNIWRMGRNAIERGSTDTWTMYPRRLEAVQQTLQRRGLSSVPSGSSGAPREVFDQVLRDPKLRDPRGYVLPSDQADFPTALAFANALIRAGVSVHLATAPFSAAGRDYPAGSIVVRTDQAFRPHVLDMFEPQDHPDDFPYPGGPPIPPYDSAGWTLAFQMGVVFDRVLDAFEGPFERVADELTIPAGRMTTDTSSGGYTFGHATNQSFRAVNRLLHDGERVEWLEAGGYFVHAGPDTFERLAEVARVTGIDVDGAAGPPAGGRALRQPRIALWDRYGGSMPSGWVRLILEQFEFPFENVFPAQIDAGRLAERFDVVVFLDASFGPGQAAGPSPDRVPVEHRHRVGQLSVERSVPQLRTFLDAGGTVVTIGRSTELGRLLGLPIGNALVQRTPEGERPLPREEYYVPGSVLRVSVDASLPIARGSGTQADVYFNNSPVFTLPADAESRGIRPVAWFASPTPLRSGWAWGQQHLDGGVAMAQATVGRGHLYLFGPEITFRAQPHGTFRFLFNGLLLAATEPRLPRPQAP